MLDLSNNYIARLKSEIFLQLGLPNLQKIFLAHSSLTVVEDHCFRSVLTSGNRADE